MHIQTNTDNQIDGKDRLITRTEETIEKTLGRFSGRITRVEVHLSDQNSHKGGQNDKRCTMEARLQGLNPTAVHHDAGTFDEAIDGAADKLKRVIENTLGKLATH